MWFDHIVGDTNGMNWGGCASSYQDDRVGYGDLNAGEDEYLAVTQPCWYSSGTLASFNIKVSNDKPWYTGASSDVPSNQYDLQSVMAHEFGHATGRGGGGQQPDGTPQAGHFLTNDTPCSSGYGSNYNTMCPNTGIGTYGHRVLESHDKSSFDAAY